MSVYPFIALDDDGEAWIVRWTDARTRQFEAGRVLGFDHANVIVSHHGRTRRIKAGAVRLSDDQHTRRLRAARADA